MAVTIKGATTIRGNTTVGFSPASLFAAGEQGVWYDPSDLSTMFTDIAAANAVTGVEQTAAVVYDKRCPVGSSYFAGGTAGLNGWLSLASNANYAPGTGDFTFEAWIRPDTWTPTGGSSSSAIFVVAGTGGLWVGKNLSNFVVRAYAVADQLQYSTLPTTLTWTHIVAVRQGTTLSIYYNGARVATTTNSYNFAQAETVIASDGTSYIFGSSSLFSGYISNLRFVKGVAVYDATQATLTVPTGPLTPVTGTTILTCGRAWAGNAAITVTGNTVVSALNPFSATTGNHATQSTSGNRPVLSARVNLLTATATLSTQSVTTVATTYTLYFTGSGSITLSGTATGTFSAGSNSVSCTAGTLTLTVSGTVTTADLRPTNQGVGLPAYQRVNTSTDYDTVGFPYYLKFDGSASSMATGTVDFTATNKMSVFAGVRKQSDAPQIGNIVELSASASANNGSFELCAPYYNAVANSVGWYPKGTSFGSAQTTTYTTPGTKVLTGYSAISPSNAVLRMNGSDAATDTTSQGTGNFGNYPLYVGSRGGNEFYFNGNLYGLIVRGAASTSDQITATENWMNSKTAAY